MDFLPPAVINSRFYLLCCQSCQNKRKTKVLHGEKNSGSSFPLLLQNEKAYCNSKSECMFSMGALLFRLLRPVQGICLKRGNKYWGFLENAQMHTQALPLLQCITYYLLFFHIKTGLENNRWNWIKHHFRVRLTVSMPRKSGGRSFPRICVSIFLTLCKNVSDTLYL